MDDANNAVRVNIVAGGAAGAEYTEGDIDATITGRAILWEDAADTMRAVSTAKPLPVVQTGALPAGTNNIGDVDVLTLPALPAGTNNIGDVDVLTLPALPAGTNNIGDVDVLTLPALPAGTNNIGDVDVLTLPALPAGTNNIGDVDVLTLPAIPAGTNNIGDVDVLTQPAPANMANAQVSVGTTATQIVAARATRRAGTIVNLGTTDVYFGVATVTTANGVLLTGTKGAAVTIGFTGVIQGIVASGTQTVAYFDEYD